MPAFISVCAFSAAWRRSRPEAQTTRIPKEFEFGLLNKKSCKGILWIIVPHLKRGIKEFCGRNFCSPKIRADNERANPPTEMGAGCPAPTLLMLLFPPLQVLLQFRDAAAHEGLLHAVAVGNLLRRFLYELFAFRVHGLERVYRVESVGRPRFVMAQLAIRLPI